MKIYAYNIGCQYYVCPLCQKKNEETLDLYSCELHEAEEVTSYEEAQGQVCEECGELIK